MFRNSLEAGEDVSLIYHQCEIVIKFPKNNSSFINPPQYSRVPNPLKNRVSPSKYDESKSLCDFI